MHYKTPSMDDFTALEVGKQIAELLHLKVDPQGRVQTSFGSKTLIGLARSVERVMYDAQKNCDELLEKTEKQKAIEERRVCTFPPIFYGDDE